MEEYTYRKDLYYLNYTEGNFRNEIVVNKYIWWIARLQFWRWIKQNHFNVLHER